MKPDKIINIGIVAHVDAGKTTLTEQLLYASGVLRKVGRVDDGTAQTDWLSVERERGISVRASSVSFTKDNVQINLIDTPGHVDFTGEVERSLSILDCAILVISAVEGIQAQTELLFHALRQTGTPTILLLNKIDRVGSDVAGLLGELKTQFSPAILPFNVPVGEGGRDCAVCPHSLGDKDFREQCVLALAETDEAWLGRYLAGEELAPAALEDGLNAAIHQGRLFPALCASAAQGVGVEELLAFLTTHLEGSGGRAEDPLSAVVYKVEHDRAMGKVAHVRMFGGTIRNRDSLYVPAVDAQQKVTQIRRFFGGRGTDIGEVSAGELAALYGLTGLRVGDVLGERGSRHQAKLVVPLLKVQVLPGEGGDIAALLAALRELAEEDPLLEMEYFPDEREIQIRITGAIQLEVLTTLLRERYGLAVGFSAPSVIYKETPATTGEGYEAYTMPKPCWAIVRLLIEPGEPGSGLAFSSVVAHDDIYPRYQHHILTSLQETLKQGNHGWEVTDLKVTLIGGGHHLIHTHPMDFFVATPMAVLNGLANTGTTLLEPMVTLRISAQEDLLGKVLGDVVGMRGSFDSPVIRNGSFTLEAKLPLATSLEYPVRLGMLSSGRALVSQSFAGYQPCPLELGQTTPRRGVDPRDRAKWILYKRSALSG